LIELEIILCNLTGFVL